MEASDKDDIMSIAETENGNFSIARAAIALSARRRPGILCDRFFKHLDDLTAETEEFYYKMTEQDKTSAEDKGTVIDQIEALKAVFCDKHGYVIDNSEADIMIKADMMEVIDRKTGTPVALSAICIHIAEELGWQVDGITIPDHFVVRLEKGGEREIFDPSNGCKILQASDLRAMVKKALGNEAELSYEYYGSPDDLEILVRLQNHIKFRQIELEDYEGALATVNDLMEIDSEDIRLLLDAGVLCAKLNHQKEAVEYLERYIKEIPYGEDKQDAMIILRHLLETGDWNV